MKTDRKKIIVSTVFGIVAVVAVLCGLVSYKTAAQFMVAVLLEALLTRDQKAEKSN